MLVLPVPLVPVPGHRSRGRVLFHRLFYCFKGVLSLCSAAFGCSRCPRLQSDLHKVIWGICGRAANVSVLASNTRSLLLVCFLNSLPRSVRLLVETCIRCNYGDVSEASCAVRVPARRSWCLLCFQRNQDRLEKKVIVAPTVCVYRVFLEE